MKILYSPPILLPFALKAEQLQCSHLANHLPRRIKEMVFVEKNIVKVEHLVQAVKETDLNATQFEYDFEQGQHNYLKRTFQ